MQAFLLATSTVHACGGAARLKEAHEEISLKVIRNDPPMARIRKFQGRKGTSQQRSDYDKCMVPDLVAGATTRRRAVKLHRSAALLNDLKPTTSQVQPMNYVIPSWSIPSVPVAGSSERFPVRHIYCVGRNYAEHAKEMGGDEAKEPPFFFTKPADAVVPIVAPEIGTVPYPLATKNYQYELELVAAIGSAGVGLAPERAYEIIYGYAVGLDMTRRDLQNDMREKKRPWDIGKSFAQAAPIAPIHRVEDVGHLDKGAIRLDVNGARRQFGDLEDMIWDVPHTIAFLSTYYELLPGDLIFSGTPAGVGAVVPGDRLDGSIDGLTPLSIVIAPPVA